jgi:hypothetical protein
MKPNAAFLLTRSSRFARILSYALLRICPHTIQDMFQHLEPTMIASIQSVKSFSEITEERAPGVLRLEEAPMIVKARPR